MSTRRVYARMASAMWIDHVIYGTADLGAAATWFAHEFALPVVPGGRHDGLGTHNRLVLLGDGSFIEVLAVADREEAMRSPVGAAVCGAVERGDGLLGWAVAVDDVGALASRLGTSLSAVGRQGMAARLTGVAEALAEPCLPFFIERLAPRFGRARNRWVELDRGCRRSGAA
jgi:Glyoxalase-like domain